MGLLQVPGLLAATEPAAVEVVNRDGRSPYVLTCEHAGRRIPEALDNLGLAPDELERHIAWDIGAEATARHLASSLDATLIIQRYSRLVIDCNRPLSSIDAIPETSDGTAIPGNRSLSTAEREARIEQFYRPFQDAISESLDLHQRADASPALLALHTFTPKLSETSEWRPWDLGLLYQRDHRLAALIDQALGAITHNLNVVHNEPYSVDDESDHTIPFHGERRNLKHVLLEIRNDHVADEAGQARWGRFLGSIFKRIEPLLASP